MKVDYPRFTEVYSREELIEYFMLNETEQEFITQFRGNENQHGVAVLLKSLEYLGYFPSSLDEVPVQVKLFIAKQLRLVDDPSGQYPWETRTRGNHFAMIRNQTGFRFPTAQDKEDLSDWLRQEGAFSAIIFSDLFSCAIQRLRSRCIEVPSENELTRIVNSALNGFFVDVHHQITQRLPQATREKLNQLLTVQRSESFSPFEKVKASAGRSGLNVVENWNGANDFIFYGRKGKFETNNPEEMEISMLCKKQRTPSA